ncbi:XRE family transcriptional regulator of biofilm formation [Bacillus pakistanensis]|uniref:XRE family transcriptional regulator of biofilm formation n=1 Tax=Rossellomorea pakistanensis TaxID=992288 RepID=A0ABS2NBV2_9BACI|nr:helix-turn-helix domain-containing protein [Bacillus pakistanensis]MBM7585294.1 XRE family transcriptional regulator of biofilm formation [Bacillus pakistanensis]
MCQELGKRIKKLREDSGLSITKLAEMAGISKGFLSNIESLKTNPSIQAVEKISRALQVPIENIINMKAISQELDKEWIELMMKAKRIGIQKEEIREFFHYELWKQSNKNDLY